MKQTGLCLVFLLSIKLSLHFVTLHFPPLISKSKLLWHTHKNKINPWFLTEHVACRWRVQYVFASRLCVHYICLCQCICVSAWTDVCVSCKLNVLSLYIASFHVHQYDANGLNLKQLFFFFFFWSLGGVWSLLKTNTHTRFKIKPRCVYVSMCWRPISFSKENDLTWESLRQSKWDLCWCEGPPLEDSISYMGPPSSSSSCSNITS